ncbi:MAG: hypothetical protein RR383_08950 [Muribaculaceae bacterium]
MATQKTENNAESPEAGATVEKNDTGVTSETQQQDTVAPEGHKVSNAVIKVGKQILKSHPDIDVVYMTTDGMAFFASDDAANHSRAIYGGEIITVKR